MIGRKESMFYCGKAGAGLAAKQINNYIANVSFLALGEGEKTFSGCLQNRVAEILKKQV